MSTFSRIAMKIGSLIVLRPPRTAAQPRANANAMPDDTVRRPGRQGVQDVDRHVGARVRDRRVMLGLTLQQLAEMIGMSEQQASRYEIGINRITAGRLFTIARALGVEAADFFEGLGAERPAEPQHGAMLELAHHFADLPSRRFQAALCELARALADR
jgi:transcriptional regulator with XRE-family HTH domain